MAHLKNVQVIASHDELVVDVARKLGAGILVRGLRNATDLQYEASFDFYNHQLAGEMETIYLHSRPRACIHQLFSCERTIEIWSRYQRVCTKMLS